MSVRSSTNGPSRRAVLRGGLAAFGGLATARLASARSPEPGDPGGTLVVLQLAGGNDGLNTIVPYEDDRYHAERPGLRLRPSEVLRIDDYRAFHPELTGLRGLWDAGRLAIVEGVGYPRPDRSHFKSFDVWHAADLRGRAGGEGWLARLGAVLRARAGTQDDVALHLGKRFPYSLYSASRPVLALSHPELYRWRRDGDEIGELAERLRGEGTPALDDLRDTYERARESSERIRGAVAARRPHVEYPDTELGFALSVCAALVEREPGFRVLSLELASYDTHVRQLERQGYLHRTMGDALAAFLSDLGESEAGRRTTVLAFSEFGRRTYENGSGGTDHGAAGPLFVAGAGVRGGLYGRHPSLDELEDGDLAFTTDFRRVYATLLERCFAVDSREFLGERFEALPLLG